MMTVDGRIGLTIVIRARALSQRASREGISGAADTIRWSEVVQRRYTILGVGRRV